MSYTREDIIIWPNDERLKGAIGKRCYIGNRPSHALRDANSGNFEMTLKDIRFNRGFADGGYVFEVGNGVYDFEAPFIVLKKEPKKKIIPFDLSLEEDRTALLGKRIVSKHDSVEKEDMLITRFFEWTDEDCDPEWVTDGVVNGSELLSNYVFYDTGKPVGKVVEE